VNEADRIDVADLGMGIWRVVARSGFMEQADVPAILAACSGFGLVVKPENTSYFLGRETIVATRKNMPYWQARYFALLSRGSQSAMEFFRIPPNRVIELGAQIEI
jgi:KUP system potassium uptake protein